MAASLMIGNGMAQTVLLALEQEIRDLVKVAQPSVVTIVVTISPGETKDGGKLFSLFGKQQTGAQQVKIGTGLIASSDGFILTKASVLRDASDIEVTLANKLSYPAEFVALDSVSGIAVLKVNLNNLTPARIAAVESLQPGSWVTVIGNALGMPHAVSVGVVSARHDDDIQISANIDPGSTGSPVFNTQGKAIGIVSGRMGIESSATTAPYFSETVIVHLLAPRLARVRDMIHHYYKTHGWIGVTVMSDANHRGRPKVLNVTPNGPAEKAGILIGDVITRFADQPIESFMQLRQMVTSRKPGESVELAVVRQDSTLKLTIPIGQQELVALNELQSEPDTDVKTSQTDREKLPPTLQIKLETQQIHQRIQALERELRQLRSVQQKHQ